MISMSRIAQISLVFVVLLVLFLFGNFYLDSEQLTSIDSAEIALDLKGIHARCLTTKQYTEIQRNVDAKLQKIWSDWDVSNFPLFLYFMHIPKTSWEIQKNKFISMILDGKQNKKFVVGFSGSSVTAGHDNYFNEAFPQIVHDDMKDIFSMLGIELIVRNQALGNNPCYPYDACMATHMGNDIDLLAWEQSMNCGRTARPLETFTRSAMRMKKSPTVLYIASGTPFWKAADCVNMTDVGPPPHGATEKRLLKQSLRASADESSLMNEFRYLKADSGVMLQDMYAGAGPMGQNVLAAQAYKCRGPYTAKFGEKSPGGGAGWHPGKLGHKLRGDNLAYFLLSILKDALNEVGSSVPSCAPDVMNQQTLRALLPNANNVSAPSNYSLESNYQNQSTGAFIEHYVVATGHSKQADGLLASSLRYLHAIDKSSLHKTPVACLPQECSTEAFCYTDYLPRESSNTLTSRLINNTSYNDEPDSIVRSFKNQLSQVNQSNQLNVTNWTNEISFFDAAAIVKSELRNMKYLDRKYIFISHGVGSHITFQLNIRSNNNFIWLCECQKGFLTYPSTMTDLDKGATVVLHSFPPTESSFTKILPLSLSTDQCYKAGPTPAGNFALTIIQNSTKQINLGYILHW